MSEIRKPAGKAKTTRATKPAEEKVTEKKVIVESVDVVPDDERGHAEATYTEEEVQAMIDKAVEMAVKKIAEQQAAAQPQIVHISADAEKIVLLFMAEVSKHNVVSFGPGGAYGQITGPTGTVIVPKAEWSRFLTRQARSMIDRRVLMVVSGMTDEERELHNAVYREGEILDMKMFTNLLNLGRGLLDIFPKLCTEHRAIVVRRLLQAYSDGDSRAMDRELIVELNRLTGDDALAPIIKGLNAADLK